MVTFASNDFKAAKRELPLVELNLIITNPQSIGLERPVVVSGYVNRILLPTAYVIRRKGYALTHVCLSVHKSILGQVQPGGTRGGGVAGGTPIQGWIGVPPIQG